MSIGLFAFGAAYVLISDARIRRAMGALATLCAVVLTLACVWGLLRTDNVAPGAEVGTGLFVSALGRRARDRGRVPRDARQRRRMEAAGSPDDQPSDGAHRVTATCPSRTPGSTPRTPAAASPDCSSRTSTRCWCPTSGTCRVATPTCSSTRPTGSVRSNRTSTRSRSGKPVIAFVTHGHFDHVGGLHEFDDRRVHAGRRRHDPIARTRCAFAARTSPTEPTRCTSTTGSRCPTSR